MGKTRVSSDTVKEEIRNIDYHLYNITILIQQVR